MVPDGWPESAKGSARIGKGGWQRAGDVATTRRRVRRQADAFPYVQSDCDKVTTAQVYCWFGGTSDLQCLHILALALMVSAQNGHSLDAT